MFFGSLAGTGVLVAIISDLANHLGCVLYLKNSVTAITFLALGTSIPGKEIGGYHVKKYGTSLLA